MGRGLVVPAAPGRVSAPRLLVGQGQQLAGLTPEVRLISDAHCKFLPPCRTRQKPREQTYPDSYPRGVNAWGYVASSRVFALVNARSPTRESFLLESLVGGLALIEMQTRRSNSPRSTTSERIVRVNHPAPVAGFRNPQVVLGALVAIGCREQLCALVGGIHVAHETKSNTWPAGVVRNSCPRWRPRAPGEARPMNTCGGWEVPRTFRRHRGAWRRLGSTTGFAGCLGRPHLSAAITWATVSPRHVRHGRCMKHAALVIPIALLSLATGCSNNPTTGSSSVRRRDLWLAADPAAGLGCVGRRGSFVLTPACQGG